MPRLMFGYNINSCLIMLRQNASSLIENITIKQNIIFAKLSSQVAYKKRATKSHTKRLCWLVRISFETFSLAFKVTVKCCESSYLQ